MTRGPAGARRKVCILSYSPLARDARVLRQAEYLSRDHDVTVVGWEPVPPDRPGVRFVAVEPSQAPAERAAALALLLAGRVAPPAYRGFFRVRSHQREMLRAARAQRYHAFYANEWNTLPLAVQAARPTSAKVVFDAHEFSPLEWEHRRSWMELYAPLVRWVLRTYAPCADASITVSPPIAERYRREYGFAPRVVLNAPAATTLQPREESSDGRVRLVHHGGALRPRRLERMIEAVALAGDRFTLTFILVGDEGYQSELRALADARAPGRVMFRPAVPPHEVVACLAGYDAGLYLLDADVYNHAAALPNKFFDFVCAGLPVCIGPSPAMAEMANEHGFGLISPSLDPAAVARTLQALTPARLAGLRAAARRAAMVLNADVEMGKVVALMHEVLEGESVAGGRGAAA